MRVRAPAAEGAANEAVLRTISEALSVPRSAVAIERGATVRLKRIAVIGVSAAEVRAIWPALVVSEKD